MLWSVRDSMNWQLRDMHIYLLLNQSIYNFFRSLSKCSRLILCSDTTYRVGALGRSASSILLLRYPLLVWISCSSHTTSKPLPTKGFSTSGMLIYYRNWAPSAENKSRGCLTNMLAEELCNLFRRQSFHTALTYFEFKVLT